MTAAVNPTAGRLAVLRHHRPADGHDEVHRRLPGVPAVQGRAEVEPVTADPARGPPCSGRRSRTRCRRCCTGRRTTQLGLRLDLRGVRRRRGRPGRLPAGLDAELGRAVADHAAQGRGARRCSTTPRRWSSRSGAANTVLLRDGRPGRGEHRRAGDGRRPWRAPGSGRVDRGRGARRGSDRPVRARGAGRAAPARSAVYVRGPGPAPEPGGRRRGHRGRPRRCGRGPGRPTGSTRRWWSAPTPAGATDGLVARVPRTVGTLFDVLYDPWPTPLAAAWRRAGGPVVDGLELLVHQAVLQVRADDRHRGRSGRPGPGACGAAGERAPAAPEGRGSSNRAGPADGSADGRAARAPVAAARGGR